MFQHLKYLRQERNQGGDKPAITGGLELLKAITNQSGGNWVPGTFDRKLIGGKLYDVSTRYSGEKLGDQQIPKTDTNGNETVLTVPVVIKDWVRDPETGATKIRFTDESLPDKTVDAHTGEEIASSIIASNPKYGGTAAIPELFAKARELGYLDESSKVRPETQITNPEIGKPNYDKKAALVDKALQKNLNRIRVLLDDTDNKIANFGTPKGSVKIDRNDEDGFYIYNWKELGFKEMPKNLSEDDIVKYLTEFGYFKKLEDQATGKEVIEKVIVSPEQKKKAQDLISKYSR